MSEEEKEAARRAAEENQRKEQEEKVNQNSKTVHCGDFDCNGSVEALDAVFVAQYGIHVIYDAHLTLAGIDPTLAKKAGDVNGDSSIDILDAMIIAQYCVGLVRSLPIGTGNA